MKANEPLDFWRRGESGDGVTGRKACGEEDGKAVSIVLVAAVCGGEGGEGWVCSKTRAAEKTRSEVHHCGTCAEHSGSRLTYLHP